jgi:magnesium transporter
VSVSKAAPPKAARRPGAKSSGTKSSGAKAGNCRIRLFDADRTDQHLSFEDAIAHKQTEHQLLWIDVTSPMDSKAAAALVERLDLEPATQRALVEGLAVSTIALHGTYFTLALATIAGEHNHEEARWLTIVAGRNVIVTVHAEPIGFLDKLDDRIEADTLVGLIDSGSFVAALLDEVVTGYFAAVDAVEDSIDSLDSKSLRPDVRDDLLLELIALRQRIARLRRIVSAHRELFAALGRPDFAAIAEGDVAEPYRTVAERYERAVEAVKSGRELLLGSFDVYMTRTAQRTNEIVKTLTVFSIVLLPAGVIASFMGMNLKAPYSIDDPLTFWLVLLLVVGVAVATLVILRVRRWL